LATSGTEFEGDRLAILTNGGGAGVLATDTLLDLGGKLAELSDETLARLDAALPRTWSRNNPIDIIGDADADRYAAALRILAEAPEADAILVLNCPTALAGSIEAARAVASMPRPPHRAILASWLESASAPQARRLFADAGIPAYDTADKAVRGFMHLVRYRQSQVALLETPASEPPLSPATDAARHVVREALADGREWLDHEAVGRLLDCYQLPAVRSIVAATPEDAAHKAEEFGGKVALKILSPDILHKSDVGGVALDLEGGPAVANAARTMVAGISRILPKAVVTGFLVQEMVHRRGAHEVILGAAVCPTFGPFLLFGQGGIAAEVIGDRAVALPPLNMKLARDLIARTRLSRQLAGYRGQPPADIDAIASMLVKLSRLVCDVDEIVELDMNPVVADASGAVVLDARIRVQAVPAERPPHARLAIRPYPWELESSTTLAHVGPARLRPVRPDDESALVEMFAQMRPEDRGMRFFASMGAMSHEQLARLTQIDYEREMVFVLESQSAAPRSEILAVARLAADPDNLRAEFSIVVRSDWKRRGLGAMLMRRVVDHARQRKVQELFGHLPAENAAAIALCRNLGFSVAPREQDPSTLVASLRL
jgi:acetyltransferase